MASKVLILILNYKSYNLTLELIKLLQKKLSYPNFDILVVDNASPNESGIVLANASENGRFQFFEADHNGGYASGNNIGLRYASKNNYSYVWILNNDILLAVDSDDVLDVMVEHMDSCPELGAINPRIQFPDGSIDYEFPERPSLYDYTFGMYSYKRRRANYSKFNSEGIIYRPQGCCMLLRVKALEDIDYLDENTFLYCEEDILAERFLARGYFCGYCGNTAVIHNHSTTVSTTFSKLKTAQIKNKSFKYYLRTYRGFNTPALLLASSFRFLTYLR